MCDDLDPYQSLPLFTFFPSVPPPNIFIDESCFFFLYSFVREKKCFGIFFFHSLFFSLLLFVATLKSTSSSWTYCKQHLENKNVITGKREIKRTPFFLIKKAPFVSILVSHSRELNFYALLFFFLSGNEGKNLKNSTVTIKIFQVHRKSSPREWRLLARWARAEASSPSTETIRPESRMKCELSSASAGEKNTEHQDYALREFLLMQIKGRGKEKKRMWKCCSRRWGGLVHENEEKLCN